MTTEFGAFAAKSPPSSASRSAQTDRFAHDRLPPPEQWPQLVYDLPELQIPEQANLVETLFRNAFQNSHGHRPFLRSDSVTLTYADALERVSRISQLLTEDFSLVPGNRVLLRGGNSIDMALAWLGVVNAGLIAVATMPLLRAKELGEIFTTAQPALALCDAGLLEDLEVARKQFGLPCPIVPFNGIEVPGSLKALSSAKDGNVKPCDVWADDIALMAFTSGTTGKPKAAVHTHRDVLAACEAWPRHVLKARPDDIVMGSPPLAFTFGLGGLLVFPMWAGCSVYYPSIPYTPEAMIKLVNQVSATIVYTAPTFYRQMAPFAKALGTPRLRLCVSAGENLPDTTRQLWKGATGIDIVDGIGATEMFHIFISSAGDELRRGAIGKVVPGYTARVVDDDGNDVPRGTLGKLAVIGPTGCRYLDDQRQTNYVRNGWNFPGDAFTQDADGYFFFQARADDLIITAGYNVAGPEVEEALLAHFAVAECAVVAAPDAERGMVVKAFVVLKENQAGDAAMVRVLQEHVKSALAPFKYPRQVEFLNTLPRTETGKLQRFKLRQT
jgi:2-aminobenzoate-CoA ligase